MPALFALFMIALASRGCFAAAAENGGVCTTEDDCSLGGDCVLGACVCDPWFTGATCALLNLQAPRDTEGGTCGAAWRGYGAWGGRSVFAAGKWHVFASLMCGHPYAGQDYSVVSSSAHLLADSPAGPYRMSAEQCEPSGACVPTIPAFFYPRSWVWSYIRGTWPSANRAQVHD
jgi:hypothetical protein